MCLPSKWVLSARLQVLKQKTNMQIHSCPYLNAAEVGTQTPERLSQEHSQELNSDLPKLLLVPSTLHCCTTQGHPLPSNRDGKYLLAFIITEIRHVQYIQHLPQVLLIVMAIRVQILCKDAQAAACCGRIPPIGAAKPTQGSCLFLSFLGLKTVPDLLNISASKLHSSLYLFSSSLWPLQILHHIPLYSSHITENEQFDQRW